MNKWFKKNCKRSSIMSCSRTFWVNYHCQWFQSFWSTDRLTNNPNLNWEKKTAAVLESINVNETNKRQVLTKAACGKQWQTITSKCYNEIWLWFESRQSNVDIQRYTPGTMKPQPTRQQTNIAIQCNQTVHRLRPQLMNSTFSQTPTGIFSEIRHGN